MDEEQANKTTQLTQEDLEKLTNAIMEKQLTQVHPSVVQGAWRPAIGWICVCALAYNYLVYQLISWIVAVWAPGVTAPPPVDLSDLWPVIISGLTVAGMRTYEKVRKVDSKGIRISGINSLLNNKQAA